MGWKRLWAWDGVLPAVIALMPLLVKRFAPRNDPAELGVVILVPIAAALIRSVVGYRQFRDIGFTAPPVWRQIMLGVGVALLMLFEGAAAMLSFAEDEPKAAWMVAGLLYGCYLACVTAAFAPTSNRAIQWIRGGILDDG